MGIDLSRFKVVYDDKVLKALSLDRLTFNENDFGKSCRKPKFIDIIIINEDGNIELLSDEAWRFQFIPILSN